MRSAALVATSCALVVPACTLDRGPQTAPVPQPVPVITVAMSEYRFEFPGRVPSGRVVFRMRNVGRRAHSATLLALPDDLPPIDQQLKGTERRYLEPFADVPPRRPGMSRSFAVDLQPGQRYALICYTIDPDEQSHAAKGMSIEFRTPGSRGGQGVGDPVGAATVAPDAVEPR